MALLKEQEAKLRSYIRKRILEHFINNGLGSLTPLEVVKRVQKLQLKEAKAIFNQKPQDNKALQGAKKNVGNTMKNGDALLGKTAKSKDVAPISGGVKSSQKMESETKRKIAKFSTSKVKKPNGYTE